MIPIDFSKAYFDIVRTCFVEQNGNDTSDDGYALKWSHQGLHSFVRQCRELFFYETEPLVEDYATNGTDVSSPFRSLHFGPIGGKILNEEAIRANPGLKPRFETPTKVIAQSLLMADTVVFQDILYRTVAGLFTGSYAEMRRSNEFKYTILKYVDNIMKMSPYIDKGYLELIPYLSQYSVDFREGSSMFAKYMPMRDYSSMVGNAVAVGCSISALPFTTDTRSSKAISGLYQAMGEISREGLAEDERSQVDSISEHHRYQVAEKTFLERFDFITECRPEDVIAVIEKYGSFRDQLRDFLVPTGEVSEADPEDRVLELEELIRQTKMELENSGQLSDADKLKCAAGTVLLGMSIPIANLISPAISVPWSLYLLKPFFEFLIDRVAAVETFDNKAMAMIELERSLDRTD